MRIAVVGAGISGLGAAWLLSRSHDVTLFEREPRLGGHSNTLEVAWPEGGSGPVDTGFIVYNTACYPNLIALFEHLGVSTARTNMSFAVSLDDGRYEYSGSGAQGLFGQPSNLLRPGHWRMAADILRFFREAPELTAAEVGAPPSLGATAVPSSSATFCRWGPRSGRRRRAASSIFPPPRSRGFSPTMACCKCAIGPNGAPCAAAAGSMWRG
ncbi:MAG: FAD-dependent oxidoreductase [Hyphomicrobium sp.]